MSQKNFMSYGDAETLFTEVGQELSDKVPKSQLTANNTDFRFGYDSNTGKYGYIINEGGADTVIPFKDCDSSEITVSAVNQILSGYKDYDSNGNLITGTNAGYDAGVTQGEANMKDGVTLDYDGNHLIQGYKARTSAGVLITGTNKGYDAGVTQGHADRDSDVTVTAASQVLSGYKARTSSGTLVTGTDAGYSAGVNQGHADRDSGVTVTDPYHILSGYKGRKSNGELVTGTNGGWDAGRSQGQADRDSGVTVTAASHIVSGYKARNSSGTLLTGSAVVGRPVSAAFITESSSGAGGAISFSATVGAVYVVAWGGRAGDTPSALSGSGFTQLAFKCGQHTSSGQPYGVTIGILQATATTVSVSANMNFPATGHGVVMRVTN